MATLTTLPRCQWHTALAWVPTGCLPWSPCLQPTPLLASVSFDPYFHFRGYCLVQDSGCLACLRSLPPSFTRLLELSPLNTVFLCSRVHNGSPIPLISKRKFPHEAHQSLTSLLLGAPTPAVVSLCIIAHPPGLWALTCLIPPHPVLSLLFGIL